jgi:nitrogen-specific signal transduction histidine kinase
MLGIAVSNNGPQIPYDIREQLFKQRVRSSKEKGTGMGLVLANQVLSTFGGNISLTTSLTDWVTFKVQLPVYKQ